MNPEVTIGDILNNALALGREERILNNTAARDVPCATDTGVEYGPYAQSGPKTSRAYYVNQAHEFRLVNPMPTDESLEIVRWILRNTPVDNNNQNNELSIISPSSFDDRNVDKELRTHQQNLTDPLYTFNENNKLQNTLPDPRLGKGSGWPDRDKRYKRYND